MNTFDFGMHSKLIDSECMIICIYVNDLLIFGTNVHIVNEIKKLLSSHFEMKDMEEANEILGIKIRNANNGFSLY